KVFLGFGFYFFFNGVSHLLDRFARGGCENGRVLTRVYWLWRLYSFARSIPFLVFSNSVHYNHITQRRVTSLQKAITVMRVFTQRSLKISSKTTTCLTLRWLHCRFRLKFSLNTGACSCLPGNSHSHNHHCSNLYRLHH